MKLTKKEKQEFKNFIATHEHRYFFDLIKDGMAEKIEMLKESPFFYLVYPIYKNFADENKIAYLEGATDQIIKTINIELTNQERANLKSFAFYCGHYYTAEKENIHADKLKADGWKELTKDVIKEAFTRGQKLQIMATMQIDWYNANLTKIYKPFVDSTGACYLMKPRARRRGILFDNLKNPFYKLV